MTVVSVVAVVSGLLLMLSRLFKTSQPLWAFLPPKFRVWLPVLVMSLPQFAEVATAAKTWEDLANLLVLIPAVVLPGAKAIDHDGDGIPDDEEETK